MILMELEMQRRLFISLHGNKSDQSLKAPLKVVC